MDDEVRASIRKHGHKISKKHRIPIKRLEQAQAELLGNIVVPGDLAYEKARRIWNVFFNPRPALIIQCQAEKDVRIALELGREFKIPVTLRSGGHTTAGYSGGTGTLVIDLKELDDVAIDAENLTATVSCGTTFGKMNAALDARGVHLPAGECDDVRMGGFMQGGGYGFTSRTFGMHSDNVTSFRMMLANGRTVTASPDGQQRPVLGGARRHRRQFRRAAQRRVQDPETRQGLWLVDPVAALDGRPSARSRPRR